MKRILLPVLLLGSLLVQAQKKRDRPPLDYQRAINASPLMLLGPDYTFTVGYEHRLRPNIVLNSELGMIVGSAYYSTSNNSQGAWGFLIRPSLRLFVNENKNFYLSPQLYYKMVNNRLHDWLGKDCVNEVPAYEQLQDFTLRRQVYGFNAIAGVLVPTKGRKMMFDFYLGFGIRHRTSKVAGEPRSCYDGNNGNFGIVDENGTVPNVPLGVRMVFVLGKGE